jgi:4-amino-4-deoxy-L-arabinose transferase-like glycosyltransferase
MVARPHHTATLFPPVANGLAPSALNGESAESALGRATWGLILGFTALRVAMAALLPLTPQEAYYWLWSQHPDWSYFDHPPLAAYSIAVTTAVFGSTSFGIKMAAVGWSLGLNVVWARLALDIGFGQRTAWWSLLALNLVGIIAAYGVVIAPDSPLLFAWAGTLWAAWRAVSRDLGRWWLAAGLFLGLGLLSKYTAVLIVPSLALFLLVSPRHRRWLARPEPYLGLLLAGLVFAPVVLWNYTHEWASFAFQTSERAAGMGRWKPRFFAQLVATQIVVATPYLLAISLLAWASAVRGWRLLPRDDGRLLLIASATVPLLLFAFASLRSLVKPNWLAPVYPPLVLLAVQERLQGWEAPRGLKLGLASSAALLLVAVLAMAWPNAPIGSANTWSGWPKAARHIDWLRQELAQQGQTSFVFATNYKNSALLAFHLDGQPRTYAQDIFGERALQFDFWPPEESLAGATGILAVDDRRDRSLLPAQLLAHFDSVERVDSVDVGRTGHVTRRIDIYLCRGYRGHPRWGQPPR